MNLIKQKPLDEGEGEEEEEEEEEDEEKGLGTMLWKLKTSFFLAIKEFELYREGEKMFILEFIEVRL